MVEHTTGLTISQEMVLTGQALASDNPLYNMAWRFDIGGAIDPKIFASAFNTVAGAQDALRTAFVPSEEGRFSAELRDAATLAFPPILDFSSQADPDAATGAWVENRAAKQLDLSKSSYDTCLIKRAENEWTWYFCQHHVATDAWSGALLFKAVSDAYLALAGEDVAPQTLGQFGDFAARENAARKSDALDASHAYWQDVADGYATSAPPYGQSRDLSNSASRRVVIPVDDDRYARLQALSTRDGFRTISADLSNFALLMTVYAAFLHRVSGNERIFVGTPAHNRMSASDRATLGLFIEMYPVSLEVSAEDSFETLYARVLASAMAFLRHAKPGGATIAASSAFNAVFNYIPTVYGDFAKLPTQIEWLHPGAHDARHDIRFHVYNFEGSATPRFEFDLNTSVFDQSQSKRAPLHFLSVLDAFLEDPAAPILNRPLVRDDEAVAFVEGPKSGAELSTILHDFARQVEATPDAVAVACKGREISYRELSRLSDNVAANLQGAGVRGRDGVTVFAERSEMLVAVILGVLKTGAYFIPISSDTPMGRVSAVLEEAKPALILTGRSASDLPADVSILRVDDAIADAPVKAVSVAPDDLAYTIFTSGSTGTPKGVMVAHDGLSRYIKWAAQSFGGGGPKSYPLYSSIGFDLTITSIFTPLTIGGTVVVYPETAADGDLSVLDVFADDAVDVVKLTPSHLALVCASPINASRISSLVLGGENLSRELCLRAQQVLPGVTIYNEYGPTEAVVGCMIHTFDAAKDKGASVPVGAPSDDVIIRILDDALHPVPIGVKGEIYIGGARLARGYLRQPELTAERFVADPFSDGRLYRSGDIGRVTEDGTIHYLGRADRQLKLRGIRVEPQEIEAALLSIDGIEHAHVVYHENIEAVPEADAQMCSECGISGTHPQARLRDDGVCEICHEFKDYQSRADAYFKTPEDLDEIVAALPRRKSGAYDAIVLLSGGKDSTYAFYRFAELTKNVLALTLDNGFLSEDAKKNIKRVTDDLGIDHRFMTTPAMNAIFNDSLTRHSNVCQGCFKTIYTLALRVAREEGIPAIVTGLSRGQFFETRLTPDLFKNANPSVSELEGFVLDARKSYHKMDDAISGLLGTQDLHDEAIFDEISFIDIYRYIDVPVSEIYEFLTEKAPWRRPDDTGRSTNCLINDVGIYVHKKREGFHNYALPYSWDVRMGHKTRSEAVDELNDSIDEPRVKAILEEIGYSGDLAPRHGGAGLVAYVVGGESLDKGRIRAQLRGLLAPELIPMQFISVPDIPLTSNGKVDQAALPEPTFRMERSEEGFVAPQTDTEQAVTEVYRSVLGHDVIGVEDNFYDLGGDSIAAIQIATQANAQGVKIGATDVFAYQTIKELSQHVDQTKADAPADLEDDLSLGLDLDDADLAAITRSLDAGAAQGNV